MCVSGKTAVELKTHRAAAEAALKRAAKDAYPPELIPGRAYYFDGRKAVVLSTNCKTWRGPCDAVSFVFDGESCTYYCTQDTFRRYSSQYVEEKHLTLTLSELSKLGVCIDGMRRAIEYCRRNKLGDDYVHDLYELYNERTLNPSDAIELITKLGLGDKLDNNTPSSILRGTAK